MSKPFLRDAQRTRLYNAENHVFEGTPPDLPPSPGVEAAARFVARILSSNWFKRHYPQAVSWRSAAVKVIGGNGNNANNNRIMLTMFARRRRWYVLHELAHTIEWLCNTTTPVQAHGREYANIYLALVRKWLGEAQYQELRETFRINRVRFHLPRKRSSTKRAGNPAALAAYRERKKAERQQWLRESVRVSA